MIQVYEKALARRWEDSERPSIQRVYIVVGTDNDAEVLDAIAENTPSKVSGLPRMSISISQTGTDTWEAVVTYRDPEQQRKTQQPDDPVRISFSTLGATQHINYSLATVGRWVKAGETAPQFYNAIAVDENGPQGIDITVPSLHFQVTKTYPGGQAPSPATLSAYTGCVNADTWYGFAPGTVLFLGAEGGTRADGNVEITYHFAAQPNVSNITIGGISGITKRGWDYLWVWYRRKVENGVTTFQPVCVQTERVYPSANFAGLGL